MYGRPAIGPRNSSQNSTPYSVKCALLRTSAWSTEMVSAETSGKSQRSIGSMTVDVFIAENVEVDIENIRTPHNTTGSQSTACRLWEPSVVRAKSFAIGEKRGQRDRPRKIKSEISAKGYATLTAPRSRLVKLRQRGTSLSRSRRMRAAPAYPARHRSPAFSPRSFPETLPIPAHPIHNAQSLPVCFARTNISLASSKQRVNIAYL